MAELRSFNVLPITRLVPSFWRTIVESNIQRFGDDILDEVLNLNGGVMVGNIIFYPLQTFDSSAILIPDPVYNHTGMWNRLPDHINDASVHPLINDLVLLQDTSPSAQDGNISVAGFIEAGLGFIGMGTGLFGIPSSSVFGLDAHLMASFNPHGATLTQTEIATDLLDVNTSAYIELLDVGTSATGQWYEEVMGTPRKLLATIVGSDTTHIVPGVQISVYHGLGTVPTFITLTSKDGGTVYLSAPSDPAYFYIKGSIASLPFDWKVEV